MMVLYMEFAASARNVHTAVKERRSNSTNDTDASRPSFQRLSFSMRHYVILLAVVSSGAYASESLCTDQEQAVFSCSVAKSSKVVSLCTSKQLSKEKGSLAYRFGSPGKVELEYPASPTNSLQQFRYAHYSRFQADRTEVTFSIGKFRYTVFDYFDENEKPKNSRGVSVSNVSGKRRETQLLCGGEVKSELQKLEEVVPCDTDNALASCN